MKRLFVVVAILLLATGAVVPIWASEPSNMSPVAEQQLSIAAANIQTLSSQPASPERTQLVEREVNVTNNYLSQTKVIRQALSKSQLVQMLKDLGYLRSGGSTWGRNEVAFCLRENILVGRTDDATPASAEWKASMTREEGAAMAARITKQTDRKIGEHDDNTNAHIAAFGQHNADQNAHGGVVGAERVDRRWLWVLSVILLFVLLALAFRRWRNRAPAGGPTVFPTPGVATPVAAGGNTGLYNVSVNTPARNGSGVQLFR